MPRMVNGGRGASWSLPRADLSTDGHRLSKVERTIANGPKLSAGVLIPKKGLLEPHAVLVVLRRSVLEYVVYVARVSDGWWKL